MLNKNKIKKTYDKGRGHQTFIRQVEGKTKTKQKTMTIPRNGKQWLKLANHQWLNSSVH